MTGSEPSSPSGRDRGDVDAVEDDAFEAELPRRRARRSPLVSGVVAAAGLFLLVTWFPDFRYWLRSDDPVPLGHARAWEEPLALLEDHVNAFVSLEGTPDVQYAARGQVGDRPMRYIRVTELGEHLFAVVPHASGGGTPDYPGAFSGRLQRLGSHEAFEALQAFYGVEQPTREVDLALSAVRAAIARGPGPWRIEAETGEVVLDPDARVWLTTRPNRVQLQLGKKSFPDRESAQRKVAELGFPFRALDDGTFFYRFVAEIPEAVRAEARQQLNEGLEMLEPSHEPDRGAVILPLTATFATTLAQLEDRGDHLVVPAYEGAPARYAVHEGALAPVAPDDGAIAIPVEEIAKVRWSEPVMPSAEGYIVTDGLTPARLRLAGIAWLLVLVLTLVNLAALLVPVLRKRPGSA